MTTEYTTPAIWSDDCQGKKDYDGNVVMLNTRYWPSSYQSNGNCSAHSDVSIQYGEVDKNRYNGKTIKLCEGKFEAPTQQEVQHMVEQWAQGQMNDICSVLMNYFAMKKQSSKKNLAWAIIAAVIGIAVGVALIYLLPQIKF